MRNLNKAATAVALSLTLGLATTAFAHPGKLGPAAQGGQHQGMQHDGSKCADCGEANGRGARGPKAAQSLATPEERTAMREKLRAAKTPEERRQIAMANHAEMQKRAAGIGITLPEHRGPHGRSGMSPSTTAPATAEHTH